MSINQNQISNKRVSTVVAAALVGRPNEVMFCAALNEHFYYVIDAVATANGTTVLSALGVNAFWKRVGASAIQSNFAATVSPAASDDTTTGFAVGSYWFDTNNTDLYICQDATAAAAVWLLLSNEQKHNFIATVAPTLTDDSASFYEVGSMWHDTVTGLVYVLSDATVGAAVWLDLSGLDNPLASTYEGVAVTALVAPTGAHTAVTNIGVDAATFNASKLVVLLNGITLIKGTDALWVTANTFSVGTETYAGDVITVIP